MTSTMRALLTELKQLDGEATAGPWRTLTNSKMTIIRAEKPRSQHDMLFYYPFKEYHEAELFSKQDAALIVALRNASPVLIECLEIAITTMEYAVGPTRDVKTPKILEALAKLDALARGVK